MIEQKIYILLLSTDNHPMNNDLQSVENYYKWWSLIHYKDTCYDKNTIWMNLLLWLLWKYPYKEQILSAKSP